MMCVIPQLDYRPGQLFLVADRTQACSAQHETLGIGRYFKPNPARRQYSNEMPAGKKQHISRHRAQAAYHAIGPRRGLGRRFPCWAAVAEQFPVRMLPMDLSTAATLIIAIVPFD